MFFKYVKNDGFEKEVAKFRAGQELIFYINILTKYAYFDKICI